MQKQIKVAVTGASGFIGRAACKALAAEGVKVIALSRAEVPIGPGKALPAWEEIGSPDILLHLAWEKLDKYTDPAHFETILPAHYAFLKNLVATGLPAMTVAGTCFEYGMQEGCLAETDKTDPHLAYGFAKDSLRRQLAFLQREVPFALTWARIFYTYGEGQPERSLYGQLMQAIARGDTVFDMSPGDQLRDFLPVEALGRRLALLSLTGQDNGVVNLGSGRPVTVKSVVERILADKGSTMRLNTGAFPYAGHEPKSFWGDCGKLLSILGHAPVRGAAPKYER